MLFFKTLGNDRKCWLQRPGHPFQQQEARQEEPGFCEAGTNPASYSFNKHTALSIFTRTYTQYNNITLKLTSMEASMTQTFCKHLINLLEIKAVESKNNKDICVYM